MSRAASPAAPLRVGVIGCGWVAERFHLPALRRARELEVVALADIDSSRLRRLADDYRVPRRYPDASALIASDVEAVAVCLPPQAQPRVAVEALRAGRHLLIEKPPALNLEDADRLMAARPATVVAVVGLNMRWHRLARRARRLIRARSLGRVRWVRTRFAAPPPAGGGTARSGGAGADPDWRRSPERGGDLLLDLGLHHFDLLRFLLDAEFEELSARRSSGGGSVSVESRLSSGTRARISLARTAEETNEVELLGDAGSLRISFYRRLGWRLRPRAGRTAAEVAGLLRLVISGIGIDGSGGPYASSYLQQWRHFARAVRREEPPEATLEEGRAALRVALAAVDSARMGRPIAMSPGPERTRLVES